MTNRYGLMAALFTALLLLPTHIHAAQPAAEPAPWAVLPNGEYNFGKVVEGTQVQNEFILKNQGKGPLRIIKVQFG